MGVEGDLGTLAPRKLADVAVWNGTPDQVASLSVHDLRNRLAFVIQGGVVVA